MHTGHRNMSGVFRRGSDFLNTLIPVFGDLIVATPAIRLNNRSRFSNFEDKRYQIRSSHTCHPFHPNPPEAFRRVNLHRNCNNCLRLRISSSPSLFFPADIAFIDLDNTAQAFTAWPHHCASQLVQPSPRRLIAAEAEDTLKPQRTGAVLLTRYIPHGAEPSDQGQTGVLKNCSGSNGDLPSTSGTQPESSGRRPSLSRAALGTNESLRPPQGSQIVLASSLVREAPLQLCQCPWVIFHEPRIPGKSG